MKSQNHFIALALLALNPLSAFQNKVRAQIWPLDAALTDRFITASQHVIVAVKGL